MPKKSKKTEPGFNECVDCGAQHKIEAPHHMFCEARTCGVCGTTYGYAIEPNSDGQRECEACANPEEE